MAEAVGIAAATLQLIDLGGRVLIASSRLCSDLKNVPRKITTARHNLQQFFDLFRILDSDFEIANGIPSSSGAASSQNLHFLTGLLNEAFQQTTGLAALLESLSTPQCTTLKRAWSAVVSVRKEEEIIVRSQRLESLKSTLQL